MFKAMQTSTTLAALACSLTLASAAQAQDNDWHFGIGTGLSSLALDGDIGFGTDDGGIVTDIDLDNGDTADLFESAFGFVSFAQKGPWKINLSYQTVTLEDDNADFDIEWEMAQGELSAVYTFATSGKHRFGVIGGVRYTDHEWEFDTKLTDAENFDPEDDWTDAIIGLTHMMPINETWVWSSQVDYGFGDSEGSWYARTGVNWKPFDNWVFSGSLAFHAQEYGEEDDVADGDYYYDVDKTIIGLGFMYVW